MAKLSSKPSSNIILPTNTRLIEEIEPQIVYIEKPIIQETIIEIPTERLIEIEKIVHVERIVEIPIIQTEYVTIREIEKVEIPVEIIKEVERIVTIHDIEQTLEERRKVNALEKTIRNLKNIALLLMVLCFGLGVICGR